MGESCLFFWYDEWFNTGFWIINVSCRVSSLRGTKEERKSKWFRDLNVFNSGLCFVLPFNIRANGISCGKRRCTPPSLLYRSGCSSWSRYNLFWQLTLLTHAQCAECKLWVSSPQWRCISAWKCKITKPDSIMCGWFSSQTPSIFLFFFIFLHAPV